MKPWGRFVFIIIAYGMALLHTAVPHHHAKTSAGKPMFSNAGCLYNGPDGGLLKRVLSTDLGFGHLETFNKGADAELESSGVDVSLVILFSDFPKILSSQESPEVFSAAYIEKLRRKLLLFSVSHFRAPPVM